MATLIDATCSECFLPQVIELNPRRVEIACEFCSHSVPMFEKRDMAGIRSALRQEKSKTYIALAVFGAAVALYGIHVYTNSHDPMISVKTADGEEMGYMVERSDALVVIRDADTKLETTIEFKKKMAAEVAEERAKAPLMTEDAAAKLVGDRNIDVLGQEAGTPYFLILAGLAGLASLVMSAIATQDRLVCEF